MPRSVSGVFLTNPSDGEHTQRLGRDWVDVLREVPLFAELPKRHVKRIADAARQKRFQPNTAIVRQGERGETFFVILDGEARVESSKRRLKRLKAGDFFGELALLDGEPRSATITAETEVLTMRLSRRAFLDLVKKDGDLALGLLKGLSGRLRETSGKSQTA